MYKGEMKPREKFRGTMEIPEGLSAKVEKIDAAPRASMVATSRHFSAGMRRMGLALRGALKVLEALYIFIAATTARLFVGHKAKAGAAPAVEVEADSVITADVEAPLTPRQAAAVNVDRRPRAGVFARLVAYNRAAAVYIANILTRHRAGLAAAPGAVAAYREALRLGRTSKAEATAGAVMESRFNRFTAESEAAGGSAPAREIPAVETVFTAGSTATAGQAATTEASGEGGQNTVHSAKMATWFPPEQIGNRVRIYQAFSAVQTGNRVAIDTEVESLYYANPYMEGNRLKVAFVAEATQKDNRLELR